MTELLFTEEVGEFTSYRLVNSRGYLEIIFASNIPRDLANCLMDKITAPPCASPCPQRRSTRPTCAKQRCAAQYTQFTQPIWAVSRTSAPKAMRYQAKVTKLWLAT